MASSPGLLSIRSTSVWQRRPERAASSFSASFRRLKIGSPPQKASTFRNSRARSSTSIAPLRSNPIPLTLTFSSPTSPRAPMPPPWIAFRCGCGGYNESSAPDSRTGGRTFNAWFRVATEETAMMAVERVLADAEKTNRRLVVDWIAASALPPTGVVDALFPPLPFASQNIANFHPLPSAPPPTFFGPLPSTASSSVNVPFRSVPPSALPPLHFPLPSPQPSHPPPPPPPPPPLPIPLHLSSPAVAQHDVPPRPNSLPPLVPKAEVLDLTLDSPPPSPSTRASGSGVPLPSPAPSESMLEAGRGGFDGGRGKKRKAESRLEEDAASRRGRRDGKGA